MVSGTALGCARTLQFERKDTFWRPHGALNIIKMPGGGQATTQQPFPKSMSNSKIRSRTGTFSVSGTSETPSGARAPKWQRRRAAVAPGFNSFVVACDSLLAPGYPPLDLLCGLLCKIMTARYSKMPRMLSHAATRHLVPRSAETDDFGPKKRP